MKVEKILSVFIPILLILWTLPGCKESVVESEEPEIIPYSGKIAFEFLLDGVPSNSEIYTIEGDGSNLINLTQKRGSDNQAVYSPDGLKIVFISENSNSIWDIHIVDIDGENQTKLTPTEYNDLYPVFSPDGSKIAFNCHQEILIMDSDGSNLFNFPIVDLQNGWPIFSPDGSKIAFSCCEWPVMNIFIINIDGSNQRRLTAGAYPVFSPDGTRIAYSYESDIYIMNVDRSEQTNLTQSEGNDLYAVFQPLRDL